MKILKILPKVAFIFLSIYIGYVVMPCKAQAQTITWQQLIIKINSELAHRQYLNAV